MKLLDDDKTIDLSELFKMFGDSTRIKIINVLLDGGMCVSDIAEKINMTQSAVSHQLRILRSSHLVRCCKCGKEAHYFLSDEHVEKIFRLGCEHINEI